MSDAMDDLNGAIEEAKPKRGRPVKARLDIVDEHGTVLVGVFKARKKNGEMGWFQVAVAVPLEQLMERAEVSYEGTKRAAIDGCFKRLTEAAG